MISQNDTLLRTAARGAFPRFVQVLSSEEALDSLNQVGVIEFDRDHDTFVSPAVINTTAGSSGICNTADRGATYAIVELHRIKNRLFAPIENNLLDPSFLGSRFCILRTYVHQQTSPQTIVLEESCMYHEWDRERSSYLRCRGETSTGASDDTNAAILTCDDGGNIVVTGIVVASAAPADGEYEASSSSTTFSTSIANVKRKEEEEKKDEQKGSGRGGRKRGTANGRGVLGNSERESEN